VHLCTFASSCSSRAPNSLLRVYLYTSYRALEVGAGGLAFARVGEDGATLEGAKALCEGLAPCAEALIAKVGRCRLTLSNRVIESACGVNA
jgi:hypothetical protein